MGFLSTCFIASANYILNEWLDADFDKHHPVKRGRPVVSEHLNSGFIVVEYIAFTVIGLVFARLVSWLVFFTGLFLFIMGLIYNVRPVRSKEIPYIDVLSESFNNALRFLTGWFAVTNVYQPPVSIVFGYWMGGAFLMAAKRFAEYRMIGDKSQAGLYRKSFKHYDETKLLISCFFYAMVSLFFCGIFLIKHKIELIIAIPFLSGLFCFYLRLCFKEDSSAQRPEKLFREKGLMLYVMALIVLILILMNINLPFMQYFQQNFVGIPEIKI
jgi:4-hydroxybenzoate polyprenyltransferase